MNEITLGKRYRDTVTGYVGIATARHEYLNGCIRYSIEGTIDKDGKMVDSYSIDEGQLELVDEGIKVGPPKRTGGPQRESIVR